MAEQDNTPSVEDRVNEIVSKATKNDQGVLVLSDETFADMDPLLVHAAKTELRYRNTQSSYTRTSQELAKVKTMSEKLTEKLADSLTVKLTSEQKSELDKLKADPEAYHAKRLELENQAKASFEEELKQIEQASTQMSELDIRKAKLEAFNQSSGIQITDEVIQNDLPASYARDLESGKISFDEFLIRAQQFLTKGKRVKGAGDGSPEENDIDLSKIGGRDAPSKSSQDGDIVETYKNTVF